MVQGKYSYSTLELIDVPPLTVIGTVSQVLLVLPIGQSHWLPIIETRCPNTAALGQANLVHSLSSLVPPSPTKRPR